MDDLVLLARCLLSLVFVLAALAKLADLASFRATLLDFGVPPWATRSGAVAVPTLELAVAALLVPAPTATVAAVAALALLLVFCAGIVLALRRGDRPDCGCFGGSDAPVGPATLARNGLLAAVAALIAIDGGGASLSSVDTPPLTIIVALGLLVQAWFGWQLFRQHGRLLERVGALERAAATRTHAPEGVQVIHRHRRSAEQRLRALEH